MNEPGGNSKTQRIMNWLLNLRTGTKLSLGIGIILTLLAVMAWIGVDAIGSVRDAQRTFFEKYHRISMAVTDLRADSNRLRGRMMEAVAQTDKPARAALVAEVRKLGGDAPAKFDTLARLAHDDSWFLPRVQEAAKINAEFAMTREQQLANLLAGKEDEVRQVSLGIQEERFEKMRSILLELAAEAETRAEEAIKRSEARASRAQWTFIFTGLAALAIGLLMVTGLHRVVARPLREISLAAQRIGEGDLRSDGALASGHRNDEVGQLAHAFERMRRSLRGTADTAAKIAAGDLRVDISPQSERDMLGNAFASMVTNLRSLTSEIGTSAGMLGAATSQISTAAAQFASQASESAAAAAETMATVEEVRQTASAVQLKTKQVADAAQRSAETSAAGLKAAAHITEGMNRIRAQMTAIAGSMTSLATQAQAVGRIIATVDELARQSNLLAVNASIEAAKAGEHGKGFSVVAKEVKALANQSKQATAQVRSILADIQKATSAAVTSTEQGAKVVEDSTTQSTEAGDAIATLAQAIQEAAEAVTIVAASTQQNVVGMDQVVHAVANINEAGARNLESTHQLEAASHRLKEMGLKLQSLVERFTLDNTKGSSAATR